MSATSAATQWLTDAEYRAAEGVSSHMLSDYRKSPALYYRKHVMRAVRDTPADWMVVGQMTEVACLEGIDAYKARFVVVPEDYRTDTGRVSTSKEAKAWKAKQSEAGLTVVSDDHERLALRCAGRVRAHRQAMRLLAAGVFQVSAFAKHETGLRLKGRADWITAANEVVDLKTCWSLDEFAADALKYHYPNQLAYYARLFHAEHAYLIAVEKQEPNRVGVWKISDETMLRASLENETALVCLADSICDDHWPGDLDHIAAL